VRAPLTAQRPGVGSGVSRRLLGACGAWIKYRVNRGQELVIGGYTPGPHGIDAIIVGYHGDGGLTYVARIRNGFVPASRRQVFEKLRPLARVECPFVNLPETRQTRWGEALTAEKMKKCIWVNPELVAQIEFLEWTESDPCETCQVRGATR
jgi:ATP-dependent DNA ligase